MTTPEGASPGIPRAWPALATGLRCGGVQPSARRRNLAQTTADQPITVSGEIPPSLVLKR